MSTMKPTYEELQNELENLKKTDLSSLLQKLKGLLFIELDKNGIVKRVNSKTCETLKLTEKEIIGKNWFNNFLPPNPKKELLKSFKEVISGKQELFEYYENAVITNDGNKSIIYWHNILTHDHNNSIKTLLSFGEDITDRKKYEQEIAKLKVAIDNSLHEIFIFNGLDLKFTFANSTAIKNLGYTFEELKNMTPIDVTPVFTKKEIFKKLAPLKNGNIKNLYVETIRQRKDKTTYPIEAHVSKFSLEGEDQFLAIINDITERKKNENNLLESENKFKAYTNQSTEGLSVADLKGNYTFVNPAFCKLVGYSEKELLQMTVFDVTADKTDTETFKKSISTQKEEPVIVELIRKNGTKFIAEVTAKDLIINGKKRAIGIVRDITERVDFERKLIESKFLLSEAQKIAKIGSYALDIETGFWTSSSVLNALFGIDKEYKKDIGGWLAIVHPKDRLQLQEYLLKNIVEDHQFFDREYRIKRINDGEERYVHGRGKLEFNEVGKPIRMIGTIQDTTNRKNVEKILLQQQQSLKKNNSEIKKQNNLLIESEQRFINLFENSPVSLWEEDISEVKKLVQNKAKEVDNLKLYLDQHPKFVSKCASKVKVLNVNKSTLKLLGSASITDLKRDLATFFTPKSFETFKEELLAIAANKKVFKCNTEFKRSSGELIYVNLEYVKIDDARIVITLSNVTELKTAKEKAEESNRLKTEFINNMSHEIRTPMNGILGFSEFLADSNISDEKRLNFVKIIQNSGHQLLKIIDDILEISKLETKQIKIFEEPFNLNDLLFELFSIFDSKAKENNTPLYLEKGLSNNKNTIKSDKSKLYKILSNLLENALKFTNVGHIEFGYKLRQENKKDLLEIYVKDTGRGIKKEDQQVIFERFVQSEKDSTNKIEGLGLGLSIAKENTELLGGTITLESAKGKGTTFFVRIPYNPIVDVEDIAEQVTDKLNILIVEDEEVNYLYLTTLLEVVLSIDCTILHAKNGLEAIHFCENNPKIDLILMDLKMPVMDGFIATKKIKELNSTIPILAQTAYSTKKEKEKAKQAGCDDFISKPITKEALFAKLKTLIPNL